MTFKPQLTVAMIALAAALAFSLTTSFAQARPGNSQTAPHGVCHRRQHDHRRALTR